jgi:cyclic pyranopterin monophosphate synthase
MRFTHLDPAGRARMVDVSGKPQGRREARAQGRVLVSPATLRLIRDAALPKGNPLEVARIAGVQAAKETSRIIPLCHNLPLDWINVEVELTDEGFFIQSDVICRSGTGVEMEALTAVAAAALTIYDMCKAVDQNLRIDGIQLIYKKKE